VLDGSGKGVAASGQKPIELVAVILGPAVQDMGLPLLVDNAVSCQLSVSQFVDPMRRCPHSNTSRRIGNCKHILVLDT
jgi:hypothetical protein